MVEADGPNGILGRALFDAFPAQPDHSTADGVRRDGAVGARNLRAALDRVLSTRAAAAMAVQRYDIRRPDGSWAERYWSGLVTPVPSEEGAVEFVVVRVEDVTDAVRASGAIEETSAGVVDPARRRALELHQQLIESNLALERVADHARHLQALTATLAAPRAPDDLVAEATAAALAAGGATGAAVAILSESSDEFAVRCAVGIPGVALQAWKRAPLRDAMLAADLLPTASPVFLGSDREVENRYPDVKHGLDGVRLGAMAALPLQFGERLRGALLLAYDAPREFDDAERTYLAAIARQCAQALERAELHASERLVRADIEAARARAEMADRAKSEFIATMSHEIRTPINAIMGYSQLLEVGLAGPITDAQRDFLHRLSVSAQHLSGLVSDILDLAKVDAGTMRVAREQAETGDAVSSAVAMLLAQAEAKGITLVDVGAGSPGVPYTGDAYRVRQILINLLSNAIKFTSRGGRVSIACSLVRGRVGDSALEGDGPWARIDVEDTGVGISAELQARMFDPFVQGEVGWTRSTGGSGLGLAISRRLARLMDGDLTVISVPRRGSTFSLWLPSTAVAQEAAVEPGSDESTTSKVRRPPPPIRVHGLADISARLRPHADEIVASYVERLRRDEMLPAIAGALPRSQLEDHASSLVADYLQSLVLIEESGGIDPRMLTDGSEIQRLIGALHGRQRNRLGWSEAQLAREFQLLAEELNAFVERRATDVAPAVVTTALDVLRELIARSSEASTRAFRHAMSVAHG